MKSVKTDHFTIMNTQKKLTRMSFYLLLGLLGTACSKDKTKDYPLLPEEQEKEMDITAYGVLKVNRENANGKDGGEGSLKVVDEDYKSKYLINPYQNDMYIQLGFPGAIKLGAYTLTSGNDAPGRDPKDWTITGSADGTTWKIVDERKDEKFAGRNETRRFQITTTESFKFYRINILSNGGESLFQLSEFRLINAPGN